MNKVIQTYINSIWDCRTTDEYERANQLFMEASKLKEAEEPENKGELFRVYAQIKRDQGDTAAALELLKKSYELLLPNLEPLREAHMIRHLADIQSELNLKQVAEINYKKALTIYHEEKDLSSLNYANALRNYALLNEQINQIEQATNYWMEARKIYESCNIEAGVKECEEHISNNK